MITIKNIRHRVIEVIKNSGLTQVELSRRLNIKHQNISKYLKGESLPSLDTLANLCQILDVSADYILCLSNDI